MTVARTPLQQPFQYVRHGYFLRQLHGPGDGERCGDKHYNHDAALQVKQAPLECGRQSGIALPRLQEADALADGAVLPRPEPARSVARNAVEEGHFFECLDEVLRRGALAAVDIGLPLAAPRQISEE